MDISAYRAGQQLAAQAVSSTRAAAGIDAHRQAADQSQQLQTQLAAAREQTALELSTIQGRKLSQEERVTRLASAEEAHQGLKEGLRRLSEIAQKQGDTSAAQAEIQATIDEGLQQLRESLSGENTLYRNPDLGRTADYQPRPPDAAQHYEAARDASSAERVANITLQREELEQTTAELNEISEQVQAEREQSLAETYASADADQGVKEAALVQEALAAAAADAPPPLNELIAQVEAFTGEPEQLEKLVASGDELDKHIRHQRQQAEAAGQSLDQQALLKQDLLATLNGGNITPEAADLIAEQKHQESLGLGQQQLAARYDVVGAAGPSLFSVSA